MEYKKFLVSLVAILAVVLTIAANVSAANFASIDSVEVNGVVVNSGSTVNVGTIAGNTVPVKVNFNGLIDATDVRLKAWISGASGYSYSSSRFDVYAGSSYSNTVAVQIPFDIDPTEGLELHVSLESQDSGEADEQVINLAAQRESYLVEILDANIDSQVQAGDNVPVDVVLKNRGAHFAEDTFVKVSIPELGVSQRAYFGDMSPVDQSDPDKEDASERRMVLRIPSSARAGVYTVQIEAYNGDSSTVLTRKLAVVGAGSDSIVAVDSQSKTFAVGEQADYTVTLVSPGNTIKVYNLIVQSSSDNLKVDLESPVVAVPAGSSETVKVRVTASKAGNYTFSVNIQSSGDLVSRQSFAANVMGSSANGLSGSTAVVLTVVLAIVFVVLLVVLIVLLTRKPEKTQEFGESYY